MLKRFPKVLVVGVSLAAILVATVAICAQNAKFKPKNEGSQDEMSNMGSCGGPDSGGPSSCGDADSQGPSCGGGPGGPSGQQSLCNDVDCGDADCEERRCEKAGSVGGCAECKEAGKAGLCMECLTKGMKLTDGEREALAKAVDARNEQIAQADAGLLETIEFQFDEGKTEELTSRLAPSGDGEEPAADQDTDDAEDSEESTPQAEEML